MFSKSSPVNKVPAMAIDQSSRKRGERDKETIFGHLDRASWDLGHPGNVRPLIKGSDKLPPEATATWYPLCNLVSSAALLLSYPPTSCCLLYTRRPTAAPSPHLETEEYCSGKYWGVLWSTGEYYSPDPVVGLFRSQRSKLLLICAPRRNLFSANGHDSKTKDVLN